MYVYSFDANKKPASYCGSNFCQRATFNGYTVIKKFDKVAKLGKFPSKMTVNWCKQSRVLSACLR